MRATSAMARMKSVVLSTNVTSRKIMSNGNTSEREARLEMKGMSALGGLWGSK